MGKIKIAPSILAADFTRLGDHMREAEAGGADLFHVDVMDGRFVPNISFGPMIVAAARRVTALPLDVHLMIVEPERYIDAFAAAGASMITVHVETCPHLHRTIQQIHEAGALAGVALNPHTPLDQIREVLPEVERVLVMSVNPGFGGQPFIISTLGKIPQIRKVLGHLPVEIAVDGGIDAITARHVVKADADVLVAGSSIFHFPDGPAAGIAALREAAGG